MAFFHQDFCHQNKRFCFSTFSVARTKNRSSRPEVFCERGVLRIFTKLTGKHLCQSPFFNKVAGLRCFPANFVKFLRTPFLTEHLQGLLLQKQLQTEKYLRTCHISMLLTEALVWRCSVEKVSLEI